jgi:hypothetical protein
VHGTHNVLLITIDISTGRERILPQLSSDLHPASPLALDRWQWLGMPRTKWEVAHLALDASQVAAIPAGDDPLLQNLLEHSVMERFPPLRGE